MKIFTVSEAQKRLIDLLELAQRDGAVRIRGNDGTSFLLTSERAAGSPFDVEGANLDLSREEIIEFIHEGRRGASAWAPLPGGTRPGRKSFGSAETEGGTER